jgi:histidyl-tRNA synthetase
MLRAIRGTKDILPEEIFFWQVIEKKARQVFELYAYQEIRTPILEEALLFNRSLGDSTEVIQKQMFEVCLQDNVKKIKTNSKTGRIVLRPEATASIVRAYIENNLGKKNRFSKFYYIGPMFRAERPQKGRLRQFHHLGAEAIGSSSPQLDIEVIALAQRLLEEFGIIDYKIGLNSLGCLRDKQNLTQTLKKGLKDKLSRLCSDCKDRFRRNVFRILDCKNESCRRVVSTLELSGRHLCPDCRRHFKEVESGLKALGIDYQYLPYLVRGLDYYTRSVFEITHKDLGSQDALGAGGRYDNLVKDLTGPDVGAIGFAFGIERLLLVSNRQIDTKDAGLIYLVTLGQQAKQEAIKLLNLLRNNALAAETDYQNKSLKGQLRRANTLGAKFALILGEEELLRHEITLKDMTSGQQRRIRQIDLIKELKDTLSKTNKGTRVNV